MSIGPMQIESKTNNDKNQDSLELNDDKHDDEESREIKTNLKFFFFARKSTSFMVNSKKPTRQW